ncbi:MAG: hypothetical protein GY941_22075 [Planctomycetes bacterium]|nr:hypothetical protein [Planctomycetota bacterium]
MAKYGISPAANTSNKFETAQIDAKVFYKAIHLNTAGKVALENESGDTVIMYFVAGIPIPIAPSRILSAGTTVTPLTDIIGLN